MKEALKELRNIVKTPDQKHWEATKMREYALEEWIEKWIVHLEEELTVLNEKFMTSDFEDFLKEQVAKKLAESAMEDAVIIKKDKNKIKGSLTCIRRLPKKLD